MDKRIYILEPNDNENGSIEDLTRNHLISAGFKITSCSEAEWQQGLKDNTLTLPDLLIVGVDIYSLNQINREDSSENTANGPRDLSYPVIAVSAAPTEEGLLDAFASGANDYVSKMVPPAELLARINNLLQLFIRINKELPGIIEYEALRIETKRRKVFRSDVEIPFTPKEYELLVYLIRRQNEICSREALLQDVWGYEFSIKTNIVDVYIKHIRTKLDAGHKRKFIHTVRGIGYMLQ